MTPTDSSMWEGVLWVLVPALFLGFVGIWYRLGHIAFPKGIIALAALSVLVGMVIGPRCLCTDPTQKLVGALSSSLVFNALLFGIAGVLFARRRHRLAQRAVRADARLPNAR